MSYLDSRVARTSQPISIVHRTSAASRPPSSPYEPGSELPLRSPGLVIADLVALRDEILSEVKQYAQQPGAKQVYVDRRNAQLQRLSDDIATLQHIYYHDLWAELDAQIQHLRAIDPSIEAVVIQLDWCSNPVRTAFAYRDLSY